jgi:threonine dehydrogenase-like Zn-dependent dehydrogenase
MYLAGTRIRFGQGSTSPHVKPTIDAIASGLLQPSTLWATRIDWDELPTAYIDEQRKLITTRHLN